MSPTTATSRALQCLELRRLICKQIGSDNKRALFRLSLSSRIFVEPALDVLWYELHNFAPLVFCMPRDLYEKGAGMQEGPDGVREVVKLSFRRSMLGSDWKSFEAAAARVHILNHSEKWDGIIYKLDSSIFRSLMCAAQGRRHGLLPRLQQLTWEIIDDELYPYISLLLSPTITHLTVTIATGNISSDRVRFSLLASLVSQCPSVRSVGLEATESFKDAHSWRDLFSQHASSACTMFSLWANLGFLTLHNMDLGTLTDVLAKLPVLTELQLLCCRITDPPSPSTVKGFPMLRCLSMNYCNVDSCLHVWNRMSYTPLADLSLYLVETSSESPWAELFNSLPGGVSRDSLEVASLLIAHDQRRRSVPLRFQTIFPLLHFRRISQLTLCPLDLCDNDVALLAQAWPCLKSFVMRPTEFLPLRLTLCALVPFAMHCPSLERLAMSINAIPIDDYKDKPGKGSYSSTLRRLQVFKSPIDDPARVSAFISDIFPNVTIIDTKFMPYKDQEKVLKQKWEEVGRLIPVFVAVRSQEANQKK